MWGESYVRVVSGSQCRGWGVGRGAWGVGSPV